MLRVALSTLQSRFTSINWVAQELIIFIGLAVAFNYAGDALGFDLFGVKSSPVSHYVMRHEKIRPTKTSILGSGRTDTGSDDNHWHNDRQELLLNMPLRAVKKDNEHYVNTRALNNNLSVSDKYDTLYRAPNAYEPEISENDIAQKLLGRPM